MPEKQKLNAKAIQTGDLARAIYELIDEFKLVRGNPRTGVAHKIVRAILDTIKGALQRGESVNIVGLGYFKLHTRPPRAMTVSQFHGKRGKGRNITARFSVNLPSKQFIKFIPSDSILKELNHES